MSGPAALPRQSCHESCLSTRPNNPVRIQTMPPLKAKNGIACRRPHDAIYPQLQAHDLVEGALHPTHIERAVGGHLCKMSLRCRQLKGIVAHLALFQGNIYREYFGQSL